MFAVDEVVVEPLPWPGHPGGHLDTTGFGSYRFEVREPGGRVTFSRGYGPIFAEWVTTAEAATDLSHLPRVVPLPRAGRTGGRGGASAATPPRRSSRCGAPASTRPSPFVNRAAPPPQALIEVERHGDSEREVDLLLLGDGYTAAQCGAKFRADATRMANALFAREPFREHRGDFNVWGICAPAAEAGVARPSADIHRRTPVGATYDIFGSERYVLTYQNRAFRDIAAWAPYEFVTILVNSATYGGGGTLQRLLHGGGRQRVGRLSVRPRVRAPLRGAGRRVLHVAGRLHDAGDGGRAVGAERHGAAAGHAAQVGRPGRPPGTPVPTPWPKAPFEAYQRTAQAERARLRAERRPEAEMDALFREELAFTTRTFEAGAGDGRRVPGRVLRRRGLLPARDRLRDVHPQPGPLLRGVRRVLADVIAQPPAFPLTAGSRRRRSQPGGRSVQSEG